VDARVGAVLVPPADPSVAGVDADLWAA